MIVRRLCLEEREDNAPARPGFQVFLASQKNGAAPRAIVTQVEHSRIAGALARVLRPNAFGELPGEALEATTKHDLGWGDSDQRQLARAPKETLQPFPAMSATDELPSWRRSLDLADDMPLLTRVLISRHFSALANNPSPQHTLFLAKEDSRRRELERQTRVHTQDLRRWTDALGFCDLLSLYLCSGVRQPALLPRAHPAETYASGTNKVTVRWRDNVLWLSEPIFYSDAEIEGEVLRFEGQSRMPGSERVRWRLAS